MTFAVELLGISKHFGAVAALDNVSLSVEKGTIHALVGENGAGKTTLMRVLYGALQPDSGEVKLDDQPHTFKNSKDAIQHGIGMVSQHYGIIPALTCLQNLILGAEGGPIVKVSEAKKRADELAKRMGFEFDWDSDAETLSPAGAQKLEILKLLWRNAKVMILDEPTAMLSPSDSEALFASLRKLVDEGATVILVTHRLPEVMDHCKTVTVLRGGKLISSHPVSEVTDRSLAELIVGGSLVEPPVIEPVRDLGIALDISKIVVKDDRRHDVLKGLDLQVKRGEVVGIAGVDGSGQRELFQALLGVRKIDSGSVSIDDQEVTNWSSAKRLQFGLRLIAEDRHEEGVIEDWSLEDNAILGLQRLEPIQKSLFISTPDRHKWAEVVAEKFSTKHGGLNQPMRTLSGGNQQRFVAARALEMSPKLILAFQPARGLDLNGTADVYAAIREKCKAGASALVVSFDLDELLIHCDRIVAMNRGELRQPKPEEARDRQAIGRLMVGAQ